MDDSIDVLLLDDGPELRLGPLHPGLQPDQEVCCQMASLGANFEMFFCPNTFWSSPKEMGPNWVTGNKSDSYGLLEYDARRWSETDNFLSPTHLLTSTEVSWTPGKNT